MSCPLSQISSHEALRESLIATRRSALALNMEPQQNRLLH